MRYQTLPGETLLDAMKRRRAQREANAAANAAARARREKLAMTCQCCANRILANTGKIAHHGYTRPGHGWQTASCMGARQLPFEVDRARLGQMIEGLKNYRANCRKGRKAVADEKVGIERSYADRSKPRQFNPMRKRDEHPSVKLEFTRKNFDTLIKTVPSFEASGFGATFDKLKKKELAIRDNEIHHVTRDIDRSQARYDGWKQTHERKGDRWVALRK